MAKIEIRLKDDDGNPLGEEQVYELEVGSGSLAEIEAAVEKFKRSALPEIEEKLLTESQKQVVKKKPRVRAKRDK